VDELSLPYRDVMCFSTHITMYPPVKKKDQIIILGRKGIRVWSKTSIWYHFEWWESESPIIIKTG